MIKVDFRLAPGSNAPARIPAGFKEAMETAASSAVVELLSAYGVSLRPAPGPASGMNLAALGLVKFAGSGLEGTATLGASSAILKRSNGGTGTDRDWIAEMANQYIGRFKLKLLRAGFELWSLAPVAVKGRLLVTGVSQPEAPPLAFVDPQGGSVAIWMELEVIADIKSKAPAGDPEIPREGDVILF